jgi:multiple sugar transport system permease protein
MSSSRGRSDLRPALAFLAPNFLGFLVFTAAPIVFSLVVSFSNLNLQRTVPFSWTGLENYGELLHSEKFWLYLVNTGYLMLGLPVAIVGSLLLAMLLSQKLRGMVAYRTLFYLPCFTSGVALMILWKALYNPEFGAVNVVLNHLLGAVGLGGAEPPKWLISTHNLLGLDAEHLRLGWKEWGLGARDALVIMGIWMAIGGNNMLLYIAALSNVPQHLYEAAQIDGAGWWGRFRHVTWPQLAPTTFFIVIMSFIGGLQGGFEQARVMTGGGPAGTTTTLSYYIYTKAFEEFQIGYASAVAWVLFVVIFGITLLNWKFGSRAVND